jgi:EpsI family protein
MTHWIRITVSVLGLSATLLFLMSRSQGEAVVLRQGLEQFPPSIGAWQGQEVTLLETEVLNILKVDDYLMRRYSDAGGRSVWLYIGYWQSQRKGAQMHSPKNCLPGSGWEPLEASIIDVPIGARGALAVNRFVIQKDSQRQVVFYWYRAQGVDVASEVAAKVSLVQNAVARNRSDGALIRVSSPVEGTVGETSARLVAYIQAMYPTLAEYLPD